MRGCSLPLLQSVCTSFLGYMPLEECKAGNFTFFSVCCSPFSQWKWPGLCWIWLEWLSFFYSPLKSSRGPKLFRSGFCLKRLAQLIPGTMLADILPTKCQAPWNSMKSKRKGGHHALLGEVGPPVRLASLWPWFPRLRIWKQLCARSSSKSSLADIWSQQSERESRLHSLP